MKLSETFEYYKNNYIIARNLSASTLTHFDYYKNALVRYVGDKELSKVTIEDVTSCLLELSHGRKSNTVRKYAMSYRSVFRFCRVHGMAVLNSELIPIAKYQAEMVEYVTSREVKMLIAAADSPRAKFVISMLYASGVRVSEFCNIKKSDISGQTFCVIGKGNKPRLCFFDDRSEKLMQEYLALRDDDSPWLTFSPQTGSHISPATVQFIIKRTRKAAHLDRHITPHTFRHGFATDLLENGVAIQDVSQMLGHSSVSTTMVYRHVTDRGLYEKYKKGHRY